MAASRSPGYGGGARAPRPFLPEALRRFLARRLVELAGLGIALAGLAFLLALVSYDAQDVSWNRIGVSAEPANWLGPAGARVADLFIQTLGAVSFGAGALLLLWGGRLLAGRSLGRPAPRVLALLAALLLGAVALAPLPAPAGWTASASAGGAIGMLMLARGGAFLAGLGLPAPAYWTALLALPAALAAGMAATGLSRTEWRALILALKRRALTGARCGGALLRRAASVGGLVLGRGLGGARTLGKRLALPAPAAGPAGEAAAGRAPVPAPRTGRATEADADAPAARSKAAPVVVAPRAAAVPAGRRTEDERQARLDFDRPPDYQLPALELLSLPDPARRTPQTDEEGLQRNAALLEGVLADFGVRGEIVRVNPGPVVTLYELEPAPGTKSSRVIGLADDIARSMSAVSVRAAVVPGKNAIGIELPNARRETVHLRELLASRDFERSSARLALALGKDIGGMPVIADLARMPHLLVAGTTGSGKSVSINTMILSLLYRLPPEKVKLILVDPKMLELNVYDGIPQLLSPVVTEPKQAVVALKWTVREMESRYRAMSKLGVRNIEGYNQRLREARERGEVLTRRVQTGFDPDTGKPLYEEQPIDLTELPYIVLVVDEMADLMMVAGKDIEAAIQRLAQMARAAGIHLIMATQRPSVDVITGTIKANFPTRISFQVTSKVDSRTILGEGGAEQLLGQGDMLFMAGGGRITRVHGPFVSDREVEAIVAYLKTQGEPAYNEAVLEDEDEPMGGLDPAGLGTGGGEGDDLYDQAVALVARERKASTSFVQRHLQIGYNRAARLIERMEADGVVGQANHVGKREVLVGDHSGDV